MFESTLVRRDLSDRRSWQSAGVALMGHLVLVGTAASVSFLVVEGVVSPPVRPELVVFEASLLDRVLTPPHRTAEPPREGHRPGPGLVTVDPSPPPLGDPGPPPPPVDRALAILELDDATGPPIAGVGRDGAGTGPPGSPFGVPGGTGTGPPGFGDPSAGGGGGDEPLALGTGIESPVLLEKVVPEYPPAARIARLQGKVYVRAVVSTTGDVVDVEVISAPHFLFEEAALTAVRKWKYRPARLGGRPVAVHFTVIVEFTLR